MGRSLAVELIKYLCLWSPVRITKKIRHHHHNHQHSKVRFWHSSRCSHFPQAKQAATDNEFSSVLRAGVGSNQRFIRPRVLIMRQVDSDCSCIDGAMKLGHFSYTGGLVLPPISSSCPRVVGSVQSLR